MNEHWNGYNPMCKCEMCSSIRRGMALNKDRKWTREDAIQMAIFVVVAAAICIFA